MKHIYITCLLLLSAFALANASQDNRAKTILETIPPMPTGKQEASISFSEEPNKASCS